VNIDIKVGDKFRVAKERHPLFGSWKLDTTRIITVTEAASGISYYPQICGHPSDGIQFFEVFHKFIVDGFLVPYDAQEPSLQPAKATSLNTDNAVCNQCGGRTKGLFSEFNGPRYCPSCEK